MKIKKLISMLTTTAIVAGILFSAPNLMPVYATEVAVHNTFDVNFDGWINDIDSLSLLTAHEGEGVDGSRALKLSNRQNPADSVHSQKGLYLWGGEEYDYSIFVRHEETAAQEFALTLTWAYDRDDREESRVIAAQTVQPGVWTEIKAQFATPEATCDLLFTLNTSSVADFWFDEFKATRTVLQSPFAASADTPANIGLKDIYANHFRVGNILNGTTVRQTPILQLILREYNSITAENEHKPDQTKNRAQSSNRNIVAQFNTGAAAINAFCAENNIPLRDHALTWHGQTPDWFFLQATGTGNGQFNTMNRTTLGAMNVADIPWVSREDMNHRLETYIRSKFALYRTQYPTLNIYAVDVVNEYVLVRNNSGQPRLPGFDFEGAGGAGAAPGRSAWTAIYHGTSDTVSAISWSGTVENTNNWLWRAFHYARMYAPEHTKLFYNDYNEFDPPKRTYITNSILRPLFERGIVDGMGMQGHISADPSATHWSNINRYREAMTHYAQISPEFEVQITELDVVTNQGNDTDNSNFLSNQPNVYRAIFEHAISINANPAMGSVTAICMWGPDDGNSWITRRAGRTNSAPLLHDRNHQPKPAYDSVAAVVPQAQWGDGNNPQFLYNTLLSGNSVTPIEPDSHGYFFRDTFENNTFGWEPRGGTTVETSGRIAAAGAESLAIRGRTATWHGAQKILNAAFTAGTAYSFSVCAIYLEGGDATEELSLTLEHTLGGETRWTNIARADAPRGQWVQLHNPNFAIPAGATNLRLVVESPTNATITFYIDEAIGAVGGVGIAAPPAVNPTVTTPPATGGTPPVTTPPTTPGANFDQLFAGITPGTSWNTANNNNPLMTQRYSADPNAMVYGDRIYVFSTNDVYERDNEGILLGNTYNRVNTINLKSSADMVNWTDHGAILAAGPNGAATFASQSWAPTATWKNIDGQDRFFLYFCNNASGIVVLTADSPLGPWTSPHNEMFIRHGRTPGIEGVPWVFDPAVFIDDDGQGYMYFGGGIPGGDNPSAAQFANPRTARVIRLGDDMISTVGEAVMIDAPYMFEAAEMFKRNGTYYFTYSANFAPQLPATVNGHRIEAASIQYMTSDNPMGPFTHRGTVLPRLGTVLDNWGNSHQDIVEFKGQHYIFYHSLDLLYARHGTRAAGYRSAHADVLNFNADGTIQEVRATRTGVPQVETLNPYETVRAATIARQAGISVRGVGNTVVTDISRGDWVSVRGASFNTGATSVTIRASSAAGAVVKIANSATGTALGYVEIPAGNTMRNHTAAVNIPAGTHNIYFIFSAPMEFETWQFASTPVVPPVTTPPTTSPEPPGTPATPPGTGATPASTAPATPPATDATPGTGATPASTAPATPPATDATPGTGATQPPDATAPETTSSNEENRRLLGDTGDSGVITITDALEILMFLAGMQSLVNEGGRHLANSLILEDSQAAGKPSISDALEILMYLAGMTSKAGVWIYD
jgi:GH35 family endo-1,4-beta-xylanase